MKKNIIISILLLAEIASGQSQVLPLDSILSAIEQNNPELQMYDAQATAFDSYAKGAKAWEAPQVGAGFFMTPYNPSMWKGDNTTNGMGSFMIQGQQMIPNPGRQRANQDYMQSMSSVEYANKKFVQNQLFADAKMAYAEWIILKKKLSVLSDQQALLTYIIKLSETRYAYQQEKLNSIYKAKAALVEIQNMNTMFETEINRQRTYLNRLMNREQNISFDVDSGFTIKNYEAILPDTASLFRQRSDLLAIDKNIEVFRYKQLYERSKGRPEFGIQYGHMFAFGNNTPNLFTLMGMVSIPIAPWSSPMYKSSVLGIQYEILGYEKQKAAIVNNAVANLESLRYQIASQKKQIAQYQNGIIPALEKNYRSSVLAYEQNTEDLFVVLEALQSLQMARMEYWNKTQELLSLQVDYEKELEQ